MTAKELTTILWLWLTTIVFLCLALEILKAYDRARQKM